MTAAMTSWPSSAADAIAAQLLYYPVTDAARHRLLPRSSPPATTCVATNMQWFWDQYTTDPATAPRSPPRRCTPARDRPRRAAAGLRDQRRSRRAARRGRSLRSEAPRRQACPSTSVRYTGTVRKNFVMLPRPQGHPRGPGRHRTGRRVPAHRPLGDVTTMTTPSAPAASSLEAQIEYANASGRVPVVFIHGLWLLPTSWDRWAAVFEEAGYAPAQRRAGPTTPTPSRRPTPTPRSSPARPSGRSPTTSAR